MVILLLIEDYQKVENILAYRLYLEYNEQYIISRHYPSETY